MLVTKSLVGEAALLAMGTALLAGIMPALTASRTEIVSALRAGR
jgi:ABC-type lipoprotein release transport system permease subunit